MIGDEIDENELLIAVYENYRSACNHWKDNQNNLKPNLVQLIRNAKITWNNFHYKYKEWLAETYDEVAVEIDENEKLIAVYENFRLSCKFWKDNQNEPKPRPSLGKLIRNAGITCNNISRKYDKWLAETYDEIFKFKYFDGTANLSEMDTPKNKLFAWYKKDKDAYDALSKQQKLSTKKPTFSGYNEMAVQQGLIPTAIKDIRYHYKIWYEATHKKVTPVSRRFKNILPQQLRDDSDTLVENYFNQNLNAEHNSILNMPSQYRNDNSSPRLIAYGEESKNQLQLVLMTIGKKLKRRCESHIPPIKMIALCGKCEECNCNLNAYGNCNGCIKKKRNKCILEKLKAERELDGEIGEEVEDDAEDEQDVPDLSPIEDYAQNERNVAENEEVEDEVEEDAEDEQFFEFEDKEVEDEVEEDAEDEQFFESEDEDDELESEEDAEDEVDSKFEEL